MLQNWVLLTTRSHHEFLDFFDGPEPGFDGFWAAGLLSLAALLLSGNRSLLHLPTGAALSAVYPAGTVCSDVLLLPAGAPLPASACAALYWRVPTCAALPAGAGFLSVPNARALSPDL